MTNGEFLTVYDVAELLGISTKTVYKYINEGQLVASKLGNAWRIKRDDLDDFVRANSNVNR